MKEIIFNSFHKSFLFKIDPSVLKPAGEDAATETERFQDQNLDGLILSSWMPWELLGSLPQARLLFFHEIHEGPKHAAMTSTVLIFSFHSNIHCHLGRKNWCELVSEMNIVQFKHHD